VYRPPTIQLFAFSAAGGAAPALLGTSSPPRRRDDGRAPPLRQRPSRARANRSPLSPSFVGANLGCDSPQRTTSIHPFRTTRGEGCDRLDPVCLSKIPQLRNFLFAAHSLGRESIRLDIDERRPNGCQGILSAIPLFSNTPFYRSGLTKTMTRHVDLLEPLGIRTKKPRRADQTDPLLFDAWPSSPGSVASIIILRRTQ
jgi:hypothetical protein